MYRWQLDCNAHFGFLQISLQWRPSIGGRRQFGAVWELLLKATAKHACVALCHGSDRRHKREAKALRLPVTLIPASLNFFAIPWHMITALAMLNLLLGCPCLPEPTSSAQQVIDTLQAQVHQNLIGIMSNTCIASFGMQRKSFAYRSNQGTWRNEKRSQLHETLATQTTYSSDDTTWLTLLAQ